MKNKKIISLAGFATLLAAVFIAGISCKKTFTDPPMIGAPDIVANKTIKDLKSLYTSGTPVAITDNIVLEGIVSCDDKSGNFYQQIAIQDASGGILLRLAGNNLYNNYPVGRQVFVKCKGLYLGQYNGTMQLGGGIDSAYITQGGVTLIAVNLQDQHLVEGALNQPLIPQVVNVSQLTTNIQDKYVNTLIKLVDFEFASSELGKNYADDDQSGNRYIQGCSAPSSNRLTLRTSNYANFASIQVPQGNGEIIGVYSFFGSTKQFTIRDTTDIKFYNPRCGTGPTTVMNIAEVRALFTGSLTYAPNGRRITGVVISDKNTNNLNARNLYLQQGNGLSGIAIRFDANHSFNLGDSIDINISGQELSEFNALLQLNNVPLSYATLKAAGKSITPRNATINEINTNYETWESTLLKILNINSLTGGTGGNWSGSVTMNDGSGTLVVFTSSAATFATSPYPATATSFTGYLSPFGTTKQIALRSLTDVVAGSGPPPATLGLPLTTSPYAQNFNGIAAGMPQGIFAKIGATVSSLGTGDMPQYGSGLGTPTAWNQTSAGLKNFASATGLSATSDATAQNASTDRALGIRQTSSAGYDPGSAYVFLLDNTTGKTNFQMSFLLQSLDNTIGRTTAWTVDYGIGDSPSSFTAVASSPASLTTSPTFGSTNVTVNFGAALNNQSQKVWIRIVTLSATTGSGSSHQQLWMI
ncbi:MAG: hypothetical protein IPM85_09380 [Chitinophagaceae bacterium]|nr:hypothetical protein [Chitinophagaceae bacterium]